MAEEAIVVAFRKGSGFCVAHFLCPNRFISCIQYDTHREVLDRLRFIPFIGFVLVSFYWLYFFIVLWDIAHAAFLQVLAWKEPPCDDVEAQ